MKTTDYAEWTAQLNVECPYCECYFDYLETEDYRSGGFESLRHCESDDEANIKMTCPECGKQFIVEKTMW